MVVGYGLKDLIVEVISATQIRFGFYLEEPDILVSSIEIVGLEIVEDATASANLSYSVGGTTQPNKTTITDGKQFDYTTPVDTDEHGLFYVTANLTNPFTSTLTVDYTSLKVNNILVPTTGVDMSLSVPNNPPSKVSDISDASVNEDDVYSYDTGAHFTDDPTDTLTFTMSGAPSTLTINSDGLITGTPVDADVGTHTIIVTAKDGANNTAESTYQLTIKNVNDDASGSVTVTGSAKEGQVLTADASTIADADGISSATLSYQWLRYDGTNKKEIEGATDSLYIVSQADVGNQLISKVSFTDDRGSSEAIESAVTLEVTNIAKCVSIRNVETLAEKAASIEINGVDNSSASDTRVIKFDVYLDTSELTDFDSLASEIRGTTLSFNVDNTNVQSTAGFSTTSNANELFEFQYSQELLDLLGDTSLNSIGRTDGTLVVGSPTAIVDIDSSNDSSTNAFGVVSYGPQSEIKLGTAYIKPITTEDFFPLEVSGTLVTDTSEAPFDSYTQGLDLASVVDVYISETEQLTGKTLDFYASDTLVGSGDVNNGGLLVDGLIQFDTVKLADSSGYSSSITLGDAITVLRDIINIENIAANTAAFHAADVNNNGAITLGDAISILRDIINIEEIDTFDLLDSNGNRVTQLDVGDASLSNGLVLVQNGDVNLSNVFDSSYVISDLV